ncbi:protein kinase [candidate division KSB1 bacterium]|nr:protein kinase [candidate division KSB1 bacterium]
MKNLTQKTIGHYKILEQIGKGGMGIVYKARDLHLDRIVAIKVLAPDSVGDEVAQERFLREARAAAKLSHANITTIHAIEQVDNTYFIDMEFVDGDTLGKLIKTQKLPLSETLNIAIQLADGLEKAHKQQVIHRDIKPDNIMISATGVLKIMDFGLAKIKGQDRLTKEGVSMGTIDYMSPEQISQEHEIDHRSDIFSFGTLLYELLTGDLPFKGDHDWAVLFSILNNEPHPIENPDLEIPSELNKLVFKCLEKQPEQRYQSINEILTELKTIREQINKKNSVKPFRTHPFLAILVLIVLLSILFFGWFSSSYFYSASELNTKAVLLSNEENYGKAKEFLLQAIGKDSTFSPAWANLGWIYLKVNQYDSAVLCYRKSIDYNPENVPAYPPLARIYEQMNQMDKALQTYFEAIRIDSTFGTAYNDAAYLLIHLKRPDEAIALIETGLKKTHDTSQQAYLYKNLGKAYLHKNQKNIAIPYLKKAFQLDSTTKEVKTLLDEVQL